MNTIRHTTTENWKPCIILNKIEAAERVGEPQGWAQAFCPRGGIFGVKFCIPSDEYCRSEDRPNFAPCRDTY